MELLATLLREGATTLVDLAPIAVLLALFQFVVVRAGIPNLARILVGLAYVVLGLTLFRVGISMSLIPAGSTMAEQLVAMGAASDAGTWWAYAPLVIFAAAIGFTATLIEPTLLAVANRVGDLSGGALRPWPLRIVIALGIAGGLFLGTARALSGFPMDYLLACVIAVLLVLALTAPKAIVPIAVDSGGIATSVVTVPFIAAYGLTTTQVLPGDSTASDGFGLILLALLGPAVVLLAVANIQNVYRKMRRSGDHDAV